MKKETRATDRSSSSRSYGRIPSHGWPGQTGFGPSARPLGSRVATVQKQDVPVEREWIGTLDGMVNAAIKAEVTGYLTDAELRRGFLRPQRTAAF